MPTSDRRNVSVRELNKRRTEAVLLRLSGVTIDQAAARAGLSRPTVIRVFKAYQAGGWEAVPVRARGRHRTDSTPSAAPPHAVPATNAPTEVADQFVAKILWMGSEPLLPGRSYAFKFGTNTVSGTVSRIKYRIDVSTPEHVAATTLELNEIGVCNISLEHEIPFDPYRENQVTGGFLVIDRRTNETRGAGMLDFALRRAHNIRRERLAIDTSARSALLGQKPCVVWLTGLSGAGKTTIANLVDSKLHRLGRATYLLDGNNIRHGLNRDLGFTDADRVENIRRISEVAKLMADAGLIVLVACISPFRSERRLVRELMADNEFFEVYVNTPLDVAEERDPKGLYRKARHGELKNFTGIDSPYEPPEHPELEIYTPRCEPEHAADELIACLRRKGML